jgi:lipopolysaccharide export system protein LptA
MIIRSFFIGIVLLIGFEAFAQTGSNIQVLSATIFEYEQTAKGRVRKLIGEVKLKQDNTLLACDSAYQYEESNYVEAFGHVHINTNDTVNIYGDILKYDGNNRKARVEKNVLLHDNNMKLTTQEVDYDLNTNKASYVNGGKITNNNAVLTSKFGNYNTKDKIFFFKKDVVLTTPDYIIKSDTLKQNTASNTTYFLGPSIITNRRDSIYCENGWYNNAKDIAVFSKKARLSNKTKILYADSLYYFRKDDYGKGYRNIKLIDILNQIEINGDFGEFFGLRKQSYVTQKAYAKKMLTQDSMYLFADTIYSYQADSITKQKQLVKAYSQAKIMKIDLQSSSDSLVYNYEDSTITLFNDPIVWSGQNQVTADTILIFINNNTIDSFLFKSTAFMISRETSQNYNQVKGKWMRGEFENSKFKYLRVFGNGQSIFYAKDDKSNTYLGVNVIDCSEMEFFFEQNTMKRSNFITQPDANFYPIHELKSEELKLKGFKWYGDKRPGLKFVKSYLIKI